ncbi:MAG: hypothetical protein K6E38_05340 [Fretibacterium sp.]|nr:hypothetical protein [Fretibacterium sp.]
MRKALKVFLLVLVAVSFAVSANAQISFTTDRSALMQCALFSLQYSATV